MSEIITTHDNKIFNERVYVECQCGCSILSFFNMNNDRWYLQHFGYCKDRQSDFEMTDYDFSRLIQFLKNAIDMDETFTDMFEEAEIGFLQNTFDKECLLVTADNLGCTQILKYHKNYKKFLKYHENKASSDIVPYKKCKCDWDICLNAEQTVRLVASLEELMKKHSVEAN